MYMLQVSFALLVGIGTSYFSTRLLMEALAMTCITVACIFLIVSSTSVDFTQSGLILYFILTSQACCASSTSLILTHHHLRLTACPHQHTSHVHILQTPPFHIFHVSCQHIKTHQLLHKALCWPSGSLHGRRNRDLAGQLWMGCLPVA